MGRCKFRSDWLLKKDGNGIRISSWGEKRTDHELFCKVCTCVVNVKNQGLHAILHHALSARHKKLCLEVFGPKQLHLEVICSKNPETSDASQSSSVALGICSIKDRATSAELIWTMKAICSNYSAASCYNIMQTFEAMFPGAVSPFSLSPKKMHYLITDALGPYFQNMMLDEMKNSYYTVSYDETTNVEDKKELQITVRYWSDSKSHIVNRHLQMFFIGKADANTLHSKISDALRNANLPLQKLLMIGSDGPNVNKKVFRLFNEELSLIRSKGLIDIGTCPIHVVHNAYLKALESLGEDSSELLITIDHYFNGWPSRWEEYEKVQEDLNLPAKKFIKHSSSRWLTFGTAAERLIEQWEGIKYYFLKHIPLKKKNDAMHANSYKKIANTLQRPCIKAELYFVMSSAELFTAFTKKFQCDEPLVHRFHSELCMLIQTLASRVCKPESLKAFQTITNIDDTLYNEKNLLPLNEVVISGNVKKELSKLNDKERLLFLKFAQKHYIAGGSHLIKKCPLSSKLVKALRCLHPEERKKSRSSLDILTVAQSLPFDVAEDLLVDEWKILQLENDEPDSQNLRTESYWNYFFQKLDFSGAPKFINVSKVIKASLALSHGNADIERRFSVSRWALTIDKAAMSERTLNAVLITKDALKTQYENNPHFVPIPKKLIALARNAHKSYQNFLEHVKNLKEEEDKKRDEEDRLRKEMQEKQKIAEVTTKNIEVAEIDLKGKKEDQKRMRETAHTLFQEAAERLKKALQKNNLKEANLAQAMFEGVSKMQDNEREKSKEVESLRRSIEKRKSSIITSFLSKKPKL